MRTQLVRSSGGARVVAVAGPNARAGESPQQVTQLPVTGSRWGVTRLLGLIIMKDSERSRALDAVLADPIARR